MTTFRAPGRDISIGAACLRLNPQLLGASGSAVTSECPQAESDAPAVPREIEQLHNPIMQWCVNQVPAVPYYHARPDKRSGIAEGAADFAILYRGKCILIEAKRANGKLSPAQRDWAHLAELQGFTVNIVRTWAQFEELVK